MKCSDVQSKLSAYYDGELSSDSHAEVAQHLAECETCATEIKGFERLTGVVARLRQPEVPPSIWSALSEDLADSPHSLTARLPLDTVEKAPRPGKTFRQLALAASILLMLGLGYWITREKGHTPGHHEHTEEFVATMDHYLRQLPFDPEGANQFLLDKYHGKSVDVDEAITLVGYRPAVADGLPKGYSLTSTSVLEMPCCTCVKAVCKRPDGSTLVLFEHEDEEVEWFGDRPANMAVCGDKECCLVDLDSSIAATWTRGSRSVTAVGVRDVEEVNTFVAWMDEKREATL